MSERRNKIVQWMLNQGRGIVDAPENVETSTLMHIQQTIRKKRCFTRLRKEDF